MPRYVLGCRAVTRSKREIASHLAATRFPEITVDLRFAAHDDDGLDMWVCRAPSENHIRRWAADAALGVDLLQSVDADEHGLTDTALHDEQRPQGDPPCDHRPVPDGCPERDHEHDRKGHDR